MNTHGTRIQCSAMLLAILACAASFASCWAAEPLRVRMLTYNIHHGEGTDGKIDLARTAAVIKRLTPDLVALQEVDKKTTRSRGVDQAAELGKLTETHVAFGKAMDFAGGQYGEAILSRYPLTEVQVHSLPFAEGCEPRCALAARVRLGVDGPEIVFASTHLEHAKAALRLCQAQKLNPALAATNALPTILAGDFNDVPDSPAIKVLQPHWTDATAGQPDPTCPSGRPRLKIDYVFFRPVDGWHVVEKQVIDEPVASDHRPLLVVLEWVPSWLTFVPEMERIADMDGRPNDSRWSAADDAERADDLRRVQAEWKTRTPTVRSLLTPERVRSLSRWAAKQMEGYTTVPPLEKAQLYPVAANEEQGTILLESTIDTLPAHSPLVTRWLKAFVRYDTRGQKIAHVTITIRGQRLE
ncbi:MAG TPA: endonuclease/exonuclease/phosphatase family protein, partial [Candidatus Anammoximicrobium sp.]|nr:endonuclease/exonuclease/phosphatase family protein [Candidatus Anammoximicrobium sp.]